MHENPYSHARPLLAYIDSHVCYDRRSIEGSSSVVYEKSVSKDDRRFISWKGSISGRTADILLYQEVRELARSGNMPREYNYYITASTYCLQGKVYQTPFKVCWCKSLDNGRAYIFIEVMCVNITTFSKKKAFACEARRLSRNRPSWKVDGKKAYFSREKVNHG